MIPQKIIDEIKRMRDKSSAEISKILGIKKYQVVYICKKHNIKVKKESSGRKWGGSDKKKRKPRSDKNKRRNKIGGGEQIYNITENKMEENPRYIISKINNNYQIKNNIDDIIKKAETKINETYEWRERRKN